MASESLFMAQTYLIQVTEPKQIAGQPWWRFVTKLSTYLGQTSPAISGSQIFLQTNHSLRKVTIHLFIVKHNECLKYMPMKSDCVGVEHSEFRRSHFVIVHGAFQIRFCLWNHFISSLSTTIVNMFVEINHIILWWIKNQSTNQILFNFSMEQINLQWKMFLTKKPLF